MQQPFSFTTPVVATPGSTFTATTALPAAGTQPLTSVSASLSLPDGWTATATTPSTFATVNPGQTAQTTWAVTVPASAAPGPDQLTAVVTYTDANGRGSVTQAGQVSLPYQETQRVSVYYTGVPLQQGKTVAYVTLPDVGATAAQGQPAMHVFAVSIG